MLRFTALILLALATTPLLMAQQPTPPPTNLLTPERLWQLGRVGLDCLSPDGQWAVYGVRRYDVAADKGFRALYLVNIATGETRPITDAEHSAVEAEFHPDGSRVGFLRGGKLCEVKINSPSSAVWEVPEMTDLAGFHYSPDGKQILFVKSVKLDQSAPDRYPDLTKTSGRVNDGLLYRHWTEWREQTYSHVFVAGYSDGRLSTKPVDVMAGERFDSPLLPDGGMEQIQWSPDGKFVAYTCRKLNGTAEAKSTNSDIYYYEVATGQTRNLSPDLPGYDRDPVFSPDGRYLAWSSLAKPGNEADRPRLMVLELATQRRRDLTDNWKWECNGPQWAADSKSLYFLSSNDFTYQCYQIGLADAKIRRITEGRHDYAALKVGANNTLVATRTAMDAPAEVFAVNAQTGAAKQLSTATENVWGKLSKPRVERRSVRTTDGKQMNVWVVLPPDFDPKKKYPALLYCQGGPQSPVSQTFSYRWNLSLMASNGYVVVAPCRRGMPGGPEGQAWNDAISGDWGGQCQQDLLSAIDDVKKEPWVDADHLGAVGASFGGYSVYWLAGHHEKRFKTFIAHCGMFNTTSWWGTTEEMWFAQHDLGGDYWSAPNDPAWTTFSPHNYVKNWDTPILVIHNELDFRVPFSEGMQAFQAAQMKGIPSRFLSFPDEGHWVMKPQNSLLWQREFFRWLDEWLKP